MISVEQAEALILNKAGDYGTQMIDLLDAPGFVLREAIYADRPMPPFDRVTMDGICIAYDSFERGLRSFPIGGTVAAGVETATLKNPEHCLEIMTGAVMAQGADTVVRVEDLEIIDGVAKILVEDIRKGQNVHIKGSDRTEGSLLIPPGRIIGAPEINVLATVGKTQVVVSRVPRVMLISTGDELVDVWEKPAPHQIRRSNMVGLYAFLGQYRMEMDARHLPDDPKIIEEKIRNYLEEYDVIILSGGVSRGRFDYVPEVLENLGVEKLFHKVFQRPGKPFWFGRHAGGTVVFALPGNPVSSFACTFRYFIPWLHASLHSPLEKTYASLASPVRFTKDLTYFAQVKLENKEGMLTAYPVQGNGSGDLANMVDADAFMEFPRGRDDFEAGEIFRIFRFR